MKFLNVDIEIMSRPRPAAFLADLGDQVLVLHDGKAAGGYLTVIELSSCPKTESKVLAKIVSLLAGLSKEAKEELAMARARRINFGYSRAKRERCEHTYPPATLQAIADLGFDLAFTIYQESPEADPAGLSRRRPTVP